MLHPNLVKMFLGAEIAHGSSARLKEVVKTTVAASSKSDCYRCSSAGFHLTRIEDSKEKGAGAGEYWNLRMFCARGVTDPDLGLPPESFFCAFLDDDIPAGGIAAAARAHAGAVGAGAGSGMDTESSRPRQRIERGES